MLAERRLKVSIWIGQRVAKKAFHDYLEEDPDTEGPAHPFARDLGEYSIDPDYLDGRHSNQGLSIDRLLKPLSCSFSFAQAATAAAAKKGLNVANAVVAIYDHEFRGKWPKHAPLVFVGVFDYVPVAKRDNPSAKNFCYLELEGPGVRKFWSIKLSGVKLVTRQGWIGFNGKETVRQFADKQAARKQYDRAIQAKVKAGFQVRPPARAPSGKGH